MEKGGSGLTWHASGQSGALSQRTRWMAPEEHHLRLIFCARAHVYTLTHTQVSPFSVFHIWKFSSHLFAPLLLIQKPFFTPQMKELRLNSAFSLTLPGKLRSRKCSWKRRLSGGSVSPGTEKALHSLNPRDVQDTGKETRETKCP